LARLGVTAGAAQIGDPEGTLFVTNDLHIGGPQRSIANLLSHMPANRKMFLGVLGGISAHSYRVAIERANVAILQNDGGNDPLSRAERIVLWADQLNVRNICLWNVQAESKLSLAKLLGLRGLRLIDVSPGPMLFEELASAADFQRRICLTTQQYFERLDCFVSLYSGGKPSPEVCDRLKVAIIPLGVPMPPTFVPLPPPAALLPRHCDPRFAIGTCTRIVPQKRLELLIDMMAELAPRVPQASLTIVGGPDSRSVNYMNGLIGRARQLGLANIFFVGAHENVWPFLNQFQVFVMVGDKQGCPNASLEALAARLPVVTNRSGGTVDQVEDGVNGFLADDPVEMARKVELLLTDAPLRRSLGQAARNTVTKRFSMEQMVARYCKLLDNGFSAYVTNHSEKKEPACDESSSNFIQTALVAAD
jgi:glycosyltransferase involved in cell wall biosynthesis